MCCAGSRLLVQESVAEEFAERLRGRIATLRVGDPLDKNTDVGAINSRPSWTRIRALADAGDAEGAQRWTSAMPLPDRGFGSRRPFSPTSHQSMRVAREEIFGPVLSVLTFRTPAEAVANANNTPYGLSAGVWTEKGSRALWMARAAAGGGGVGEHVQPVRPGQPLRRHGRVRLRPGGRPPGPGRLPRRLTAGSGAARRTARVTSRP